MCTGITTAVLECFVASGGCIPDACVGLLDTRTPRNDDQAELASINMLMPRNIVHVVRARYPIGKQFHSRISHISVVARTGTM